MKSQNTIIENFAEFAVKTKIEDIPKRVIEKIKLQILNSLTAIKFSDWHPEAMKIYNSSSPKIYWNEDFIYPINSKITSAFGTKRVYNNELKSYHGGTDFQAKDNTPIVASNSGIVRISANRFYAGNSIVIDHGQGVYSCYFHLNTMNFKVGDFVNKGEVIGLSGSTGRITGPHLHFTFRINGLQVDPLQAIEILNSLRKNS